MWFNVNIYGWNIDCLKLLVTSTGDMNCWSFVEFMLQLNEIKQCKDCYYHSNKKNKDWFCMPCVSDVYLTCVDLEFPKKHFYVRIGST